MPAATKPFSSAGSSLHVSAALPATFDNTGYSALTFTEVGEITAIGELGREYNLVTFQNIKSRGTTKRKGSYNEGALPLTMARVAGDAGHVIMIAGLNSDNSHSFKVTLQDGTKLYFTGQIMSYKTSGLDGPDSIVMANSNIEIDTAIVEVAPT